MGGDPLTLLEMERWDGRGKGGAWNSKSSNLEHDPRKVSLDFSNEWEKVGDEPLEASGCKCCLFGCPLFSFQDSPPHTSFFSCPLSPPIRYFFLLFFFSLTFSLTKHLILFWVQFQGYLIKRFKYLPWLKGFLKNILRI